MTKLLPPAGAPVRTSWSTLVAVCVECHGGKRFAKDLRASFKRSKARDVRVVRSSCLDVCPKRGVTVATLRTGTVATVVIDPALERADDHFRESIAGEIGVRGA